MKILPVLFWLLLAEVAYSLKYLQTHSQLQEIKDLLLGNPHEQIYSNKVIQNTDESNDQLEEVDVIYYNGTILTMNDNQPVVQAISIKNGVIVQMISNAYVFSRYLGKINKIKLVNLYGKTMMPGFYDAHSHILFHSLEKSTWVRLASPPLGNITSIPQLLDAIRSHIKQKNIQAGEIVYCGFYNQLGLIQRRHITRLQLDQVSKDHIIAVQHISGHLTVASTKTIESVGITDTTPDPPGGVIQRFADGPYEGTPTGLFKERAKLQYTDRFSGQLKNDSQSQQYVQLGIQDYIQAGVTTAQQGYMSEGAVQLLLEMKDKVKIDIRGYYPCIGQFSSTFDKYASNQTNRFKLQGIKLLVDGSIQGYTGFLTQPYFVQANNTNNTYRGFSRQTQAEISQTFHQGLAKNIDIIAHANGDAAIDIYLQAIREGKEIYPLAKSRVTIIHAQVIREDQLDQAKRLGVIPSFFVGHTYYWGDQHRDKFLGPQRANRISPAGSALAKNMIFTLHNDAPVTPIQNNGIFSIAWSAVNRLTLTGKVLGQDQRINTWQALKALTINAAYQGHQQATKGSIEKGKIADLIILSDNPLKIEAVKLREVTVLETIKNGVSIYKKQ